MLEAAGGLEDHKGRRERPEPSQQEGVGGFLVGELPALTAGPRGDVEAGFGDIDADEDG